MLRIDNRIAGFLCNQNHPTNFETFSDNLMNSNCSSGHCTGFSAENTSRHFSRLLVQFRTRRKERMKEKEKKERKEGREGEKEGGREGEEGRKVQGKARE